MTNFRGFAVAAASIGVPAVLFLAIAGPSGALLSQYFGVAALIAMALSQIIATRARFVEPLFGPLDQAYVLHKWLGIIALLAILLHDSIGAEIKSVGAATKLSDLAEGMGDLSLNGLLTLLAISLITIIPYRIWYWTHRAMGACFVLGALHFALILKPFSVFDPLGLYALGFCVMGVASYIYTLTPKSWRRGYLYTITSIERTANASVITMAPTSHPMHYRSGQFAFFAFDKNGRSEFHPFTISSAPRQDGTLRISVATLGDHTTKLERTLAAGQCVNVHGPYGRFSPVKGKKPQVWIAGGIGITPFLSALEDLTDEGPTIDLLYTYRGAARSPHLQDVQALAAKFDRVTLHLFDTSNGPRLTSKSVAKITHGKKPTYSYCGPSSMRDELKKGLGSRDFYYEAFEIRTSLPQTKELIWATYRSAKRIWKAQKLNLKPDMEAS